MRVEYTVTADSLAEVKHIVDLIEGLEAKPEPVQSVVGAAGCGVKQGESGVGASRETIAELKTFIKEWFEAIANTDEIFTVWRKNEFQYLRAIQCVESIEAAAQEQDVL